MLRLSILGTSLLLVGCDSGGSTGGAGRDVAETFTVTVMDTTSGYPYSDQNRIGVAYAIGGEVGRVISLQRGQTYEFVLDYTSNHPFYVGTNARGMSTGRYSPESLESPEGRNGEGASVFFTVPDDAPSTLSTSAAVT